ncbi:DNA polymerase V [Enterococcus sp. DIV2402]|uniref:DNA polymerase V n=1 Tax=Candidatus Enterococcus lowellii TaxID=2230877 RepID=A0ABZ2SQB2_9ENTE
MSKLALDNESKHNKDMKAEWRYASVPDTVWKIAPLEDMWGIGRRTAKKLRKMGILGTQLYAHSWGIDRSFLGQTYKLKSKSIGNAQVFPRDYTNKQQLEVVIKEMADQVGTRLRREEAKVQLVSLGIGFSLGYTDWSGKGGFHQQVRIPATNATKDLTKCLLCIFEKYYKQQDVHNISVNCSDLIYTSSLQLNLFEEPEQQVRQLKTDLVLDTIRKKFGFGSIVHAHSLLEGGRAIARSSLVGGDAGGLAGIEGVETHDSQSKTNEKGIS